MKPSNKKLDETPKVSITIAKEKLNNYNEAFENTLNNIHAIALYTLKTYGRLGYQIKIQEQILAELKKLNKDKK